MVTGLLGKETKPQNDGVRKIKKAFDSSFRAFKADKEVVGMLSLAERYEHDGLVKGLAIGEARGANRIVELIKSGLTPDEALRKIEEDNARSAELRLEN